MRSLFVRFKGLFEFVQFGMFNQFRRVERIEFTGIYIYIKIELDFILWVYLLGVTVNLYVIIKFSKFGDRLDTLASNIDLINICNIM